MLLQTEGPGNWLIPLVIVHLLPFVLIPVVMWIFSRNKDYYNPKINSLKLIYIGLFLLLISMAMGLWTHIYITNFGYKTDKFNIYDNIIFTIMATSFSLIAFGLKRGKYEDILMILGIISIPIGYATEIEPFRFLGQTIGLAYMVIRSYQVLHDWKIIWVPFFSVVMNVFFLILESRTHHPVFHLLHDLCGTLLGFAIFGLLFELHARSEK